MPCPSNDPWFHHSSNILWRTQSMKLKITQFSPSLRLVRSCHVIHHGTHLKGHVLPSGRDAKFPAWVNVMGSVHHTFNIYVFKNDSRDDETANCLQTFPAHVQSVPTSFMYLISFYLRLDLNASCVGDNSHDECVGKDWTAWLRSTAQRTCYHALGRISMKFT